MGDSGRYPELLRDCGGCAGGEVARRILREGSLPRNPITGYRWKFSEDPEGVVKLVSHDYSPSPPQRIGSGGYDHWVFEGVETGETTVTFEYVRAWETGVKPEKTVRYEVGVE